MRDADEGATVQIPNSKFQGRIKVQKPKFKDCAPILNLDSLSLRLPWGLNMELEISYPELRGFKRLMN
jgi:hypothetical protein